MYECIFQACDVWNMTLSLWFVQIQHVVLQQQQPCSVCVEDMWHWWSIHMVLPFGCIGLLLRVCNYRTNMEQMRMNMSAWLPLARHGVIGAWKLHQGSIHWAPTTVPIQSSKGQCLCEIECKVMHCSLSPSISTDLLSCTIGPCHSHDGCWRGVRRGKCVMMEFWVPLISSYFFLTKLINNKWVWSKTALHINCQEITVVWWQRELNALLKRKLLQ